VLEQDQLSEHGRDYLARMSSAARRMQDLIDDLLRFSRVTTNTRPFVAVDLAATAHEVRADLEGVIDETGATVELGELPTVQADPLQMRQLLQNLLSNALKFHRDGVAPHVKVVGRVDGRLAEIAVSDDGIGFDERYAQRIFRVFERLHGRGVYPGTGIGLALCRKIVERHGGTITATSAPGEGATFLVTLPLEHSDGELEWIAGLDPTGREAGFTAATSNDRSGEQPYVAV
jgi:signal transduction histidine kinase